MTDTESLGVKVLKALSESNHMCPDEIHRYLHPTSEAHVFSTGMVLTLIDLHKKGYVFKCYSHIGYHYNYFEITSSGSRYLNLPNPIGQQLLRELWKDTVS